MDYNNILRQVVNELTINGEESNTNQNNEDENLPSMDDDTNEDTSTSEEETQNNDSAESEEDELPSMNDDTSSDDTDDSNNTSETTNSSDEMEDELPSIDDDSSDDSSSSDTDDIPESNPEDTSGETNDGEDTGGDELPSMDDDTSGDEGEDSNSDNQENEESSYGEETEEENPIEKIKKIEEELFSNLSDDQMAIKNAELKGQFMTLYSTIGATLVRINDIPKSEDNIDILKFITDKLLELREMIDFNITKAYKTRSYIENTIIYQQCIATLNAISEIISNLPNISPEKNPGEAELQNEENEKGAPVDKDNTEHDISNISDTSVSDYHEESYSYNSLF